MSDAHPAGDPAERIEDAVADLLAARDSFVKLAMVLREIQFQTDATKRGQALLEVEKIFQRIREMRP